jgi:hypothetical protein
VRLLRDPLIQFLAIGAIFFIAASLLTPPPADDREIVVDRAALLEFIQFRSKAFDAPTAEKILDGMGPEERNTLIDELVREEVAYREARKLGLEADDYVVKQRLVQKFDFLQETLIGDSPPSEKEIAAWYEAHKADYVEPPFVTFTHVFFSSEARGEAAAEAAAEEMTMELLKKRAPFEAAPGKGDRFPFGVNFVDRSLDDVASQFGEQAARSIFSPDEPLKTWRGPLLSPYGAHAVFVRKVTPERTPTLDEVRKKVIEDAGRDARERAKAGLLEGAKRRYRITVEPSVLGEAASP